MRPVLDREWHGFWRDVVEAVFVFTSERSPFCDPAWPILPIPEYPWRGESPAILRVGGPLAVDEFAPFWGTLAEIGESELCIVADTLPEPVVIAATPDGARSLGDPRYTAWIVGRTASWGMLAEEGRLSILGGTPEFIARYLRHAGGEEAVRKRFEDHDIGMGWEASWPDDEGKRLWRERTYAMFGWPPPAYPNEGTPFVRFPTSREVAERWRPAFVATFLAEPTGHVSQVAACIPPEWSKIALSGHLVRDGGDEALGIHGYVRPKLISWWGLTAALAEWEDWEIGIRSLEPKNDETREWSVTLAWVRGLNSAENARDCPVTALGAGRRWSLISCVEGVSILAAKPNFMNSVVKWANGISSLVSEFEAWAARSSVPTSVLDDVRRMTKWP